MAAPSTYTDTEIEQSVMLGGSGEVYYHVTAVNQHGESGPSGQVYFVSSEGDGQGGGFYSIQVQEPGQRADEAPDVLMVEEPYPNPIGAGKALQIRLGVPDQTAATVELIDVRGRSLSRSESRPLAPRYHHIGVRTADLAPGVYLVRVTTSQGTESVRFSVL